MRAQSDREISAALGGAEELYASRRALALAAVRRYETRRRRPKKTKRKGWRVNEKKEQTMNWKRKSQGGALNNKGGGMRLCVPYTCSHARMLDSLPLGGYHDGARTKFGLLRIPVRVLRPSSVFH